MESSFVALDGYVAVRGDANSLVRKHDSCLFIRETFKFVEIDVVLPNVVAVHLLPVVLWILSLYRPPSNTLIEDATLLLFISDFCEGREVVRFLLTLICLHYQGLLMICVCWCN